MPVACPETETQPAGQVDAGERDQRRGELRPAPPRAALARGLVALRLGSGCGGGSLGWAGS